MNSSSNKPYSQSRDATQHGCPKRPCLITYVSNKINASSTASGATEYKTCNTAYIRNQTCIPTC